MFTSKPYTVSLHMSDSKALPKSRVVQRVRLLVKVQQARHLPKPLRPIKCCQAWAMPCLAPPARAVVNAKAWLK